MRREREKKGSRIKEGLKVGFGERDRGRIFFFFFFFFSFLLLAGAARPSEVATAFRR